MTLLLIALALVITVVRGGDDMYPLDPKLIVGLTLYTFVGVIKSFGVVVGLNVFAGYLIKWPSSIVLWIPIGTVFVLVAHQQLAGSFGLMSLDRIGRIDAFLMYLPAVSLASFAGGLLRNLFGKF
ncbi:MAG: hypothetical protein CSA68_08915 [Rhodobacterales bacterium]|nr:MAG: hypothetical protein CSA68_08915 [Rhodobacterales bacterium]